MKNSIYRFFSLFVGITSCFLCLEVILRILAFKLDRATGKNSVKEQAEEVQFFQYDSLLGWRGKASISGYQVGKHFKVWVSQNALGLRDKKFDPQKVPGRQRILILGDSQTWGSGIEEKDRFSNILEELLRKKGMNVEVLNFGITGYGTDQEYLLFREVGVKFNPDVVMVAFYWNDLFENSMAVTYGYPKPQFIIGNDGKLNLTNVPVPQNSQDKGEKTTADSLKKKKRRWTLKNWIEEHSYAYQAFANAVRSNAFLYRLAVKLGFAGGPSYDPQSRQWKITKRLLRKLRSSVIKNGSDFMMILIPDRSDFEMAIYPLRRPLIEDLGSFPSLDLYPLMFSREKPSKVLYQNDIHLSAQGHQVVAEVICDPIASKLDRTI